MGNPRAQVLEAGGSGRVATRPDEVAAPRSTGRPAGRS